MLPTASTLFTVFRCQANDQRESAFAFENRRRLCPTQEQLGSHCLTFAGVEAVSGAFRPVYRDVQVRLARNPENAEIGDSFELVHDRSTSVAIFSRVSRSGPTILTSSRP